MNIRNSCRLRFGIIASFVLAGAAVAQAQSGDAIGAVISSSELREAGLIFTTLSATSPADASVVLRQATMAYRGGRVGEAQALLSALHERFPSMPEPLNNLAAIAAESGRLQEAKDLLHKALDTHPGYESAYRNLGQVYAELAAVAYSRALTDREVSQSVRVSLGLVDRIFETGKCGFDSELHRE